MQVFMLVAIVFCIVQLLWYSLLCHSFPPNVIMFVFLVTTKSKILLIHLARDETGLELSIILKYQAVPKLT